ncbi:fimbrial protein [Enterobacter sp. Cy-643]|uniref:fimbrial protein n=1 Tax=Enterobacter sp. Cy-643 TaxID=2608346 RepID=UPI00256FEE3B|nr:fimbrial protein [Enterobacter sp. Cy-643]
MPILPPDTRCRLSVSNPLIDYGVMSRWQLEDIGAGRVSPGTRSLTISVVCPYSRTMILQVEGEGREGGLRYGEHGTTRLRLLDAQLDGNAVELHSVTPDGVITESDRHRLALNAGQRLAPVMQGRLAEGKILTARLEIQPVLAEGDARVSSRQRSETTLTLTLDDE